jgi:hypothetical protein
MSGTRKKPTPHDDYNLYVDSNNYSIIERSRKLVAIVAIG